MILTYDQIGFVMESCLKSGIDAPTATFNDLMNKGYTILKGNNKNIKTLAEFVEKGSYSIANIGNDNYIIKENSIEISTDTFKKLYEEASTKGMKQISKSELQNIWDEKDLAKKKEKALKLIKELKYQSKSVDKIIDTIKNTNKTVDIDKAITNLMFVQHGEKVIK